MSHIRRLQPGGLRSAAASAEEPGRGAHARYATPANRRKAFVVVVDDQLTGRKILEELVRSIDGLIEVESFADPKAALARIAERTPDLILTDYKMPGMDGIDFVRRVRRLPGCHEVPLVVVTVVEDRRIRYDALDAGATDFLSRPIDQYECKARCRNLLTLRRQQKIIRDRAHWLEDQVAVATRELRCREREALTRLAKAGEYRAESSGNHIHRIARYARVVAEGLGLPAADCEEIEMAAPLHDVGKIGLPDGILLKETALSPEEFEVMQTHTVIGYEILKDSKSRYIRLGAEIALGHHEHFDGTGYPNGLSGEEIPLAARIVAVADVFDALTSRRPHKRAIALSEATAELRKMSGRTLDPMCVDAFLKQFGRIREIHQQYRDDAEEK